MTMTRTTKDLLRAKRDGGAWTNDEIERFVRGVVDGDVTSAQAAAFLMAACTRGLDARETAALTMSMARSGARIERGTSSRPAVDKHSTGGVGDKTSLLIVPLAVECGLAVPMISGRGLGHTGGTVDKLESVVGYRTAFDVSTLRTRLQERHYFMVGQSADIAPADKVLYALRDVTGTVENIGLITASILSKKFAEGIDGLVMDMKVGRGAFMPSIEAARDLATSMRDVCREVGVASTFVFTRMDRPLGTAIGNFPEMLEAERCLADVDATPADLRAVTLTLTQAMVRLADPTCTVEQARDRVMTAWHSGAAHRRFHEMLALHGGDWQASLRRWDEALRIDVVAEDDGFVPDLDARAVADVGMAAGVGRMTETDAVDPLAGIVFHVRSGAHVQRGDVIAEVTSSDAERCRAAADLLRPLTLTTTAPVEPEPLVVLDVW